MLGNDVVDLRHAETRPGGLSPRFDGRVFGEAERRLLAEGACPGGVPGRVWRWRLWAAKESAYKVARKRAADIVWSPVRFAVRLAADHVSVEHPRVRCRVVWQEGLPTEDGSPEWVHALASDEPGLADRAVWAVGRLDEIAGEPGSAARLDEIAGEPGSAARLDEIAGEPGSAARLDEIAGEPGSAARRLACARVGAVVGGARPTPGPVAAVHQQGRIPWLHLGGSVHDLSLSHHGRFVAFACDPTPRAQTARAQTADEAAAWA